MNVLSSCINIQQMKIKLSLEKIEQTSSFKKTFDKKENIEKYW